MSSGSAPPQPGSDSAQNNNSRITQSFRDQKQLEAFVRSNKLLKIIEGAAEKFLKKYRETKQPEDTLAAIFVALHLEYVDFVRLAANELLHLVIEEPLQFVNAARYCIYSLVREQVKQSSNEQAGGPKSIDIDQVHVQLRFIGLPLQEDLLFEPSQRRWRTGLSLVAGVLSAFTEPQKAIIQSVWFCATGCSRNKIKSESTNAPTCNSCGRQMSEYTKLRVTESYRLLRILPSCAVETPRVVNKIFRALTVHVRDHVYDCELRLGERYLITGHYDYHNSAQTFQAWNLIAH